MKLNRSLIALLCTGMLATAVYAEDAPAKEKKEAPKTEKKEKAKAISLTLPWKLLTTLTLEQKEKISKIHADVLEETKKLKEKEETECMAVLTPEQKDELEKALEKQKTDMKEKKAGDKKPADSKPADPKPAE